MIVVLFGLVAGAVLLIDIGLMIRNAYVSRFRQELLDRIYELNRADIYVGTKDTWVAVDAACDGRWAAYDAVSHNAMWLRFWRPLRPEAWWEDTSFLQPRRPENEVTG